MVAIAAPASIRGALGPSIVELLAQNALFQAVAGVEQHPHRDGLVREHLDPADMAMVATQANAPGGEIQEGHKIIIDSLAGT